MQKKVSVITVNYNHSDVTEDLLASIERTNTYPNIEIIVVDNGSKVNPVPGWEHKYPGVKFIHSRQNLGFAGGNNLGIEEATGEYMFFVNNDTEFTPGLVQRLVDILEQHPEVGMVSPKIHYFDKPGLIQYAGFSSMNYYTARTVCIGQFEEDKGQYDNSTGETGFVHGAAMMVRGRAISEADVMPENYFLYYEEMDWCEQIRRAGYKIWVDTQSLIYHKESVSVGARSKLKEYYMNRNRILFIRRNCPFATRAVFWFYFMAVVAPRNVFDYIRHGEWKFIGALYKAISWNFFNSADTHGVRTALKR